MYLILTNYIYVTLFSKDLIKPKDSIIMKYNFKTLIFGLIIVFTTSIAAHGGGLNKQGCHNETKTGGYHCHRGSSSRTSPSVTLPSFPATVIKKASSCTITIGDQYFKFKPDSTLDVDVNFKNLDKQVNIKCS